MEYRILRVIALMKTNLHQRLTLAEMAQAVSLTPSHLCRIFKAEIGGTPAKYLRWLRLQKAKEYVETTQLSVKEIMTKVGLKDESHFVRDFEMAHGLSPRRYRAHYHAIKADEIED